MEKELSAMKSFLKEFNEKLQSPTSEDIPHRVINYSLDPEDITGQIIDWIINYLDNKKCPYPLALAIAKDVAHQVSASFAEIACNATEEELEKSSNAVKLFNEALSTLPSVCSFYLNEANFESLCSAKYATSVFAIKNKRRKMEDRHVVHHDLNALLDLKDAPYQSYYAVFDGHSGIDAASYASAQLHINIAKHPEFLTDTCKAITEGYQITDLNFLNKCNKGNLKSGCTAVCALIRENIIYLSWLGDSLAILVKEGVPQSLTNPHKPEREDERLRIEGLGGHITYSGTWRVNGLLAITRAIGDPDHKPFIISEPEVTVINLNGDEDFLILACDGLWDGLSPEDVTSVLYHYLADCSFDEPSDAIAAKLVHQSKLQGSEDNITAIVIFLRDAKVIKEASAKFMMNSPQAQNENFISINGNIKCSPSNVPFSKPTVLELNSASSKKLKNTANVMSSTGLEGNFQYQYFENTMDTTCQIQDPSDGDNQNAFLPHQSATTSCFAPEATALSELPTPPIDDMLASQQFDNFYSTDLYKEFNNSLQTAQTLQSTEVNRTTNLISDTNEQNADININVDSRSLSGTNVKADSTTTLSTDEAVDIASTIVTTAVETAVKCLSSNEGLDSAPAQSTIKLNPYAKPFVMKSFFNYEDSQDNTDEAKADSELVVNDKISDKLTEKISDSINQPTINVNPEQVIENNQTSYKEPIDKIQSVADSKETEKSCELATNISLTGSLIQQDYVSTLGNTPLKSSIEQNTSYTEKIPELNNELLEIQSSSVDQLLQGDITDEKIIDYGSSNVIENFTSIIPSPEKISSSIPEIINEDNLAKVNNQEFVSEANTLEDVSSPLSHEIENMSLNAGSNNSFGENLTNNEILDQLATPVEVANIDLAVISGMTSETKDIKEIEISTSVDENSKKSNMPEFNQNVLDMSIDLDHARKSEKESKTMDIKKPNIESAENVKLENPDSTALLGSVTKEPISFININNELISAGTEVPSDPSVEDSHLESIAVDLKSLPLGIPEAEGVTEDIDSDSEKDGGWSYMKGNTVSGSKSKIGEKSPKSLKSNDLKSTTLKTKKDTLATNLDSKNRIKNTADKTKGTSIDKTKTISTDKAKIPAKVEKIKVAAVTPTTEKSKKNVESKPDVKTKIMKSSTLTTSSRTTSKISTTTIKKDSGEISKPSIKPTRPTTLLRNTMSSSRPVSAPTDKNAASKANLKPVGSLSVKAAVSDNKVTVKSASTISKRLPSAQNKPITSVRSAPSRPLTTIPSRTTGVSKSASQLKSASNDSKPKPIISATVKKIIPTSMKKPDGKEVKDNVNKQILAKKNVTKVEPSSSTLITKRVTSINKPNFNKTSSNTAKSEVNKNIVPRVPPSKLSGKCTGSKLSQIANKGKEKVVQNKTDQAKNNLNMEILQKTVVETSQLVEEKFILEADSKEVVTKEKGENSNEVEKDCKIEKDVIENGSLSASVTPVEEKVVSLVKFPPDNL